MPSTCSYLFHFCCLLLLHHDLPRILCVLPVPPARCVFCCRGSAVLLPLSCLPGLHCRSFHRLRYHLPDFLRSGCVSNLHHRSAVPPFLLLRRCSYRFYRFRYCHRSAVSGFYRSPPFTIPLLRFRFLQLLLPAGSFSAIFCTCHKTVLPFTTPLPRSDFPFLLVCVTTASACRLLCVLFLPHHLLPFWNTSLVWFTVRSAWLLRLPAVFSTCKPTCYLDSTVLPPYLPAAACRSFYTCFHCLPFCHIYWFTAAAVRLRLLPACRAAVLHWMLDTWILPPAVLRFSFPCVYCLHLHLVLPHHSLPFYRCHARRFCRFCLRFSSTVLRITGRLWSFCHLTSPLPGLVRFVSTTAVFSACRCLPAPACYHRSTCLPPPYNRVSRNRFWFCVRTSAATAVFLPAFYRFLDTCYLPPVLDASAVAIAVTSACLPPPATVSCRSCCSIPFRFVRARCRCLRSYCLRLPAVCMPDTCNACLRYRYLHLRSGHRSTTALLHHYLLDTTTVSAVHSPACRFTTYHTPFSWVRSAFRSCTTTCLPADYRYRSFTCLPYRSFSYTILCRCWFCYACYLPACLPLLPGLRRLPLPLLPHRTAACLRLPFYCRSSSACCTGLLLHLPRFAVLPGFCRSGFCLPTVSFPAGCLPFYRILPLLLSFLLVLDLCGSHLPPGCGFLDTTYCRFCCLPTCLPATAVLPARLVCRSWFYSLLRSGLPAVLDSASPFRTAIPPLVLPTPQFV